MSISAHCSTRSLPMAPVAPRTNAFITTKIVKMAEKTSSRQGSPRRWCSSWWASRYLTEDLSRLSSNSAKYDFDKADMTDKSTIDMPDGQSPTARARKQAPRCTEGRNPRGRARICAFLCTGGFSLRCREQAFVPSWATSATLCDPHLWLAFLTFSLISTDMWRPER